jgi:hypothetical protein
MIHAKTGTKRTHDKLEVLQILLSHGIRLGNHWDQIDPGAQPLHHLDIEGLDPGIQLGPCRPERIQLTWFQA